MSFLVYNTENSALRRQKTKTTTTIMSAKDDYENRNNIVYTKKSFFE